MKKYLLTPLPLIICTIISFFYANKEPHDYPHPSYPYSTEAVLSYLSSRWFIIGIVLSVIFLCILLIEDLFDYIEKKKEQRFLKLPENRDGPA
jgi:hypothetical protein